jgi:hypothetical protein
MKSSNENDMKSTLKITSCAAVAALALSTGVLLAQNEPADQGIQGTGPVILGGNLPGGAQVITMGIGTNGVDAGAISKALQEGLQQVLGGRGTNLILGANSAGGLFGGPGGFDPAEMMQRVQQHRMESIRDQLGVTDDAEWEVVKPLVQRVTDAQQEGSGMGGLMRPRNLNLAGGGGMGLKSLGNLLQGQSTPEQEALQKVIDDNAPAAQIREQIAKYRAAQQAQQARLQTAQANLRKVLTAKQEAQAMLLGLLN